MGPVPRRASARMRDACRAWDPGLRGSCGLPGLGLEGFSQGLLWVLLLWGLGFAFRRVMVMMVVMIIKDDGYGCC